MKDPTFLIDHLIQGDRSAFNATISQAKKTQKDAKLEQRMVTPQVSDGEREREVSATVLEVLGIAEVFEKGETKF